MLNTNPRKNSRKGDDDHCWTKANRCPSAPSVPPVMPSYWLFSVVATSLHISCNNITWCTVWLGKTHLQFKLCYWRRYNIIFRVSIVLLGKSIPAWLDLWHWWQLSEYCRWWKTRSFVPLSPTSSPPLNVYIYQLGPSIITNICSLTWM